MRQDKIQQNKALDYYHALNISRDSIHLADGTEHKANGKEVQTNGAIQYRDGANGIVEHAVIDGKVDERTS